MPQKGNRFRRPPNLWPWSDVPLDPAQWANMNAVLAKLHVATHVDKLEVLGLFALKDALEWKHDMKAFDDLVPAAAVWVVFAGKALEFNNVGYAQHPDDLGTGRLPCSVGPSWKGKNGFSIERWEFWKERIEIRERR